MAPTQDGWPVFLSKGKCGPRHRGWENAAGEGVMQPRSENCQMLKGPSLPPSEGTPLRHLNLELLVPEPGESKSPIQGALFWPPLDTPACLVSLHLCSCDLSYHQLDPKCLLHCLMVSAHPTGQLGAFLEAAWRSLELILQSKLIYGNLADARGIGGRIPWISRGWTLAGG